jgi:hypothetical protein
MYLNVVKKTPGNISYISNEVRKGRKYNRIM